MTNKYNERFNEKLVDAFNDQINRELQASYFYLTLAANFGKSSVALPGFRQHFLKESEEEKKHAQQLIDYMNLRGKDPKFDSIKVKELPEGLFEDKRCAEKAVALTLELEREFCDHIYKLVGMADEQGDHHMEEFMEHFLDHQVRSTHELEHMLTHVRRSGIKDGLYSLDQEILRGDFKAL